MSKLTEALKEIKIYNEYGLTSKGNPMIYYISPDPRTCRCSGWRLSIKGYKFKDVAWYDNGDLFFLSRGKEHRNEALQEAIDKCKELFPDIEMVKGPWRMTYVSKVDLDKAKEELKNRGLI